MKVGYVVLLSDQEAPEQSTATRLSGTRPSARRMRGTTRFGSTTTCCTAWVGRTNEGIWEGWTTMTALAEATSRVEIGSLVLCNQFRNPAILAKMAHTFDEISEGRLILGMVPVGIVLSSTLSECHSTIESPDSRKPSRSFGRFSHRGRSTSRVPTTPCATARSGQWVLEATFLPWWELSAHERCDLQPNTATCGIRPTSPLPMTQRTRSPSTTRPSRKSSLRLCQNRRFSPGFALTT